MDILTFVGSLTEPVRLALMGSGLIIGALLLRKVLLFGHSALKPLQKPTFRKVSTSLRARTPCYLAIANL